MIRSISCTVENCDKSDLGTRETKSAIINGHRLRNVSEITVITRSAEFKHLAAKLAVILAAKNSCKLKIIQTIIC